MALQLPTPRKMRTREHVVADQSRNFVERAIIDEGYIADRPRSDYGFDLVMTTCDEEGYIEPGCALFQLKSAETLKRSRGAFVFDVDVRDYNLWTTEVAPVILVLYEGSTRRAVWLDVQQYFRDNPSRRPKKGSKTVRVLVPVKQAFNRRSVARIRGRVQETNQRFRSITDG